MNRTFNDEIKKAGIKYLGHSNKSYIEIIGSSWRIEIPPRRLGDFTKLFPEMNWEDGRFLEDIKGKYIRVTYDVDNMNIYSIHHIVKNINYMVKE